MPLDRPKPSASDRALGSAVRSFGRPPLVGRQQELEQMRAALDGARQGRGGIVLLAGEPGIGKTRLAEELAAEAERRGVRALWGRCLEGQGAPAFWPWVQILRSAADGQDLRVLRDILGTRAAAVATLLPELPATPPPASSIRFESPADRFYLFESVVNFLIAAGAGRPLLLILDDLHWADTPSLLLLESVAQSAHGARILLLGGYRDGVVDRGDPLAGTLGRLARMQGSLRLHLRGLQPAEVGEMVAGITGAAAPAAVIDTLSQQTDGNPFFVGEIARLLADERPSLASAAAGADLPIPPSVRDVIGLRLARLDDDCRGALTLAATIGREFSVATLEAASDEPVDLLFDLMAEAERAQIVREVDGRPGSYRFTHALIRETVYNGIPRGQRSLLHRRVGEALERAWGRDPEHLAEIAHHYLQATTGGSASRALDYALQASRRALAMQAYEEGVRCAGMALQALEFAASVDRMQRCELLLVLGEAQTRAGDTAAGRQSFWRVAEQARTLRETDGSEAAGPLLARAALGVGGLALTPTPPDARLTVLLEEALACLGEADSPLRAQVITRLAAELQQSSQADRQDALSREAVAIARRTGDPRALAVALIGRHSILRGPDRLPDLLDAATEALHLAQSTGDTGLALWAYRARLVDVLQAGDVAAFDQDRAAHALLAERLREPYHLWLAALWRAMRLLLDGRFAEAERATIEATEQGHRGAADIVDVYHFLQMSAVREERGSPAEFVAAFYEVPDRFPTAHNLRGVLAVLHLLAGRAEDARREYERLFAIALPRTTDPASVDAVAYGPHVGHWPAMLASLARLCVAFGDTERAGTLYALLRPYDGRAILASPSGPGVVCHGAVSHYLGILAAMPNALRDGRAGAGATQHFEDALAMHNRMGARAWLAQTEYAYAELLLRGSDGDGGDAGRGRALLERAHAAAMAMEMERLAARVQRLLDASATRSSADGGPVGGRRRTPYPDGLSEREVEVLRLVAAGQRNREIAGALVLTVNTVENHLKNIYAKIGARGRAEATAYAHRHGLVDPRPGDR